jgi:Na+-transporting NADH:ubiquinone oxidoreductase subunit NqrA
VGSRLTNNQQTLSRGLRLPAAGKTRQMIKQSESITKLAIALAKFQANCPTIEKKKDNPFFKSKYAALDDIIQAIP